MLQGFFRLGTCRKQIGSGSKGIGKEGIAGQLAYFDKISACCVNHDGRAAGIDFNTAHVREISHGCLVNKAVSARPLVFWQRMGNNWNVLKVGHALGPAATKGI